jgi:hypothetical protein
MENTNDKPKPTQGELREILSMQMQENRDNICRVTMLLKYLKEVDCDGASFYGDQRALLELSKRLHAHAVELARQFVENETTV